MTLALCFFGGKSIRLNGLQPSSVYLGLFIAGILYAYALTAVPATALFFLLAKGQNVYLAGFTAGLGALFSDVIIFLFIRSSFADEIEKLQNEKIILALKSRKDKFFGRIGKYLMPVLAGILIAAPLPTEAGIAILASLNHISRKQFLLIAYMLHTAGIFLILLIGNAV